MEFQLEVERYRKRVAGLESTVERLQRELKSLREAKSSGGGEETSSSEQELAAVTDVANDGVESSSAGQLTEVCL